MRLVDADALKESIVTETLEKDRENLTRRLCYPCKEFFTAIDKAPTIEEHKKEKWNTYYHGGTEFSYSCARCGYGAPFDMKGGKVFQKKWNYCPNCGAKMEG